MRALPLLAALLLPGAPAATTASAPASRAATPGEPPGDAALRSAWDRMDAGARRDLIEWFRVEAEWLDTFQQRLIRWALEQERRDPGTWPEDGPAPTYDPEQHAPAQPIPREPMRPGARADRARAAFFEQAPERRLDSAWRYDYPSGELRRTADPNHTERVFANALEGFPPNLDLAEALVERMLDDGARRDELTAFAHAYSDRDGKVVPGVTLYDAWCSGRRMEMPDVECLGVLHDLTGDRKSFRAPVPARMQDALYDRIGELFVPARRHRGLRHALARCYLTGDPVLRDGYAESVDRFHALWERHASTPAKLASDLPDADEWEAYLERLAARCREDAELRTAGERRRATLEADAARVRALLVRLLREAGHLDAPAHPGGTDPEPPR